MSRRAQARQQLAKDIIFILIGVALTLILVQIGLLDQIIHFLGGQVWGSFVAGIFFTSAFTMAPAAVALTRLAETTSLFSVALWGALGAMCGDLILFLFIRDRFADDLAASLKPSFVKHILSSFHLGFLKWLSPVLGALIIASPLPDEVGLGLMGISKTRVIVLLPVSFFMNMLGIYFLAWFAHFL